MAKTSNLVERMSLMMFLALVVVSACGGTTTAPEISNVVPVASTISETVPASSTTPSSVAAAETQLLDVIELDGLSIHVDPSVSRLDEVSEVIDVLLKSADEYPLDREAIALLKLSGDQSQQWVSFKARELNCLYESVEAFDFTGMAEGCGMVLNLGSVKLECKRLVLCKNLLVVAAHEFFHIYTAQRLEPCICEKPDSNQKIPHWYNEGVADFAAYGLVYGKTSDGLARVVRNVKSESRLAAIPSDLGSLEVQWGIGPELPWFSLLYDRSFLAIALLVEQFDEEMVLDTLFDNVVATGHFSSGFETTFGKTEAQFSEEFDAWLQTL